MANIKNLTSGCLDVLIVQQEDGSYKSTPFQLVFGNVKFANTTKLLKEVKIEVNGAPTDVKMFVNRKGQAKFEKKITRRDASAVRSDDSDFSDDDRSERSRSKTRSFSPGTSATFQSTKGMNKLQQQQQSNKKEKIENLKNQSVPFWHFAWMSRKKEEPVAMAPIAVLDKEDLKEEEQLVSLEKIEEEVYEGEDNSADPQFLLSLCGHLLKKDKTITTKEILKIFHSNQVKYKDFIKDPFSIVSNQNLVVKIEDSIYTWDLGLSVIIARMCYGRKLSEDEINKIIKSGSSWLGSYFSSNKRKYVIEPQQHESQRLALDKKISKPEDDCIILHTKTPGQLEIKGLNLVPGANTAKFIVADSKQTLQCKIFLWDYKTKIVVSDIDGTITKTDVFGQLLPAFKQSWIHDGVVSLFHHLKQQGYEIVYLTARAIVQYNQTRDFLFKFVKEGDHVLPMGPVFTSPEGLVISFKREVIDKQPDFLKTQILTAIKQTFPIGKSPIMGAFGNKQTDAIAYRNSGIRLDKIFIIGENSVINIYSKKDVKTSYKDIFEKVKDYFPDPCAIVEDPIFQASTSEVMGKISSEEPATPPLKLNSGNRLSELSPLQDQNNSENGENEFPDPPYKKTKSVDLSQSNLN